MFIGLFRHLPAPRGTHDKPLLDKEWFIYFLNSTGFFSHGSCNGCNTYRATFEFINNGQQDAVIHFIEAVFIHIQGTEGVLGDTDIDDTIIEYLGKIPDPS